MSDLVPAAQPVEICAGEPVPAGGFGNHVHGAEDGAVEVVFEGDPEATGRGRREERWGV